MSHDYVQLQMDGALAQITLNGPKLNAVTLDMQKQLRSIVDQVEQDEAVRAIMLTGANGSFSSGADLSGAITQPEDVRNWLEDINYVIGAIYSSKKPWVAVCPGPIVGVACGLALACDHIVLADEAYWFWSFSRIGLGVDGGASYFIPQLVGPLRAKEILFSGRKIPAAEALTLGLGNQVEAGEAALAAGQGIAKQLSQGPTLAYGAIKGLVNDADGLLTALEAETQRQMTLFGTHDAIEGVMAFMQKRSPNFEGR